MSEAEILDSLHSFNVSLLGLCGSTQLHLKKQNSVFCELSIFLSLYSKSICDGFFFPSHNFTLNSKTQYFQKAEQIHSQDIRLLYSIFSKERGHSSSVPMTEDVPMTEECPNDTLKSVG